MPELHDQRDTLIGARVDYIEHKSVAALVYQHGNHQVGVFVWPSSALLLPRVSDKPIEGFYLGPVQAEGFDAITVSDMNLRELRAFGDRWRAAVAAR